MITCSFCEKEAIYEHRYAEGLYFCEGHKYIHITLNHMKKKMSNRVMVKIGDEGEYNENKC